MPSALAPHLHADGGAPEDLLRDPAVGFLAHAPRFRDALASGEVLAPAKNVDEMRQIIFNDMVDAALAFLFVALVIS